MPCQKLAGCFFFVTIKFFKLLILPRFTIPIIINKEVKMTAKQAIKARCHDCLAGLRQCFFENCIFKGLAKSKQGADRTKAIRKYCQWCMNNNPVNQCNSPDCPIYQYRAAHSGVLRVSFNGKFA